MCLLCIFFCSCTASRTKPDDTAYEKVVSKGYNGTIEEFLAALVGENEKGEKNAYEIVSENGFNGTYEEWLSLLNINTKDEKE